MMEIIQELEQKQNMIYDLREKLDSALLLYSEAEDCLTEQDWETFNIIFPVLKSRLSDMSIKLDNIL